LPNNRLPWRLLLGIMAVLVFGGLLLLACTGLAARPMADDYCYDNLLGHKGFWDGQVYSYFGSEVPYAGNRYALTLGMAVSGPFGPVSSAVLPGLVIGLWVSGLFAALSRAARLAGLDPGAGLALTGETRVGLAVAAAALVFFTLYIAPNRVQVLYWRNGMLTYLAPLAAQAWLAAAVFGAIPAKTGLVLRLAGVFGMAFLAAGFSETATTLQAGLLGAGGLAALLLRRRTALWPLAAALLGTGLAGVVLVIAPLNQARLAISYGAPNNLPAALLLALDSTRTFIQLTLYRGTVPFLFSGLFFWILAYAWFASRLDPIQFPVRKGVVGFVLVIILGLTLIFGSMIPGAYAESSYPGERALIVARFISLLVASAAGLLGGSLFWEWVTRRNWGFLLPGSLFGALAGTWLWILLWVRPMPAWEPAFPDLRAALQTGPGLWVWIAAASGGALVGCLWERRLGFFRPKQRFSFASCSLAGLLLVCGAGFADLQVASQIQPLAQRAFLWDGRDAQIRNLQAQGEKEVTVQALDSLAGILELQENPGHWVNRCAAGYYGLESLRAVQPVLTFP
jgi:hypothetical protein